MPWQMAPPLLIIAGAFTFTGYALNFADYLYYGRVSYLVLLIYRHDFVVRIEEPELMNSFTDWTSAMRS